MTKKVRVLVAEDEPADVLLLQRAFKKAVPDAEVTYAGDGKEVIDLLSRALAGGPGAESPPDVLMLDLGLPVVSGFEVLDWISAHDEARPRWVAVFTSSLSQMDLAQAFRSHVDHYMVKPSDPDELATLIKLIVEEGKTAPPKEENREAHLQHLLRQNVAARRPR